MLVPAILWSFLCIVGTFFTAVYSNVATNRRKRCVLQARLGSLKQFLPHWKQMVLNDKANCYLVCLAYWRPFFNQVYALWRKLPMYRQRGLHFIVLQMTGVSSELDPITVQKKSSLHFHKQFTFLTIFFSNV